MEFRKKHAYTGVTGTVEKVKTGSFNCAQSMIAICTNSGVLKLQLVLTMAKSQNRDKTGILSEKILDCEN